jgi:glycosyltransferase involved in cell wall biosynthesis
MTNPMISVVVPAYNVAATIHETLVSITNQTFSNIEIIVVDDGATDATPDILAKYADPRLRVREIRAFSIPRANTLHFVTQTTSGKLKSLNVISTTLKRMTMLASALLVQA